MKIVILGAAGRTGQQLVQQALDGGREVTAFVRPAHPLELKHAKLTIKFGDALNTDDLADALRGSDAVISTVSSNKLGGRLVTESTRALIKAATAAQVRRVMVMSTFLVAEHYRPGLAGKLVGGLMKGVLSDKTGGEDLLKASDLDWTIVHAAPLTSGPLTGKYRVLAAGETVGMTNKISRADVASCMLSKVVDPATFGKTITITTT